MKRTIECKSTSIFSWGSSVIFKIFKISWRLDVEHGIKPLQNGLYYVWYDIDFYFWLFNVKGTFSNGNQQVL